MQNDTFKTWEYILQVDITLKVTMQHYVNNDCSITFSNHSVHLWTISLKATVNSFKI